MTDQRRPSNGATNGKLSVSDFFTVAEAAVYLKVSPKTVRKYIDNGLLPAKRLPWGHFRIPRSHVDDLLV